MTKGRGCAIFSPSNRKGSIMKLEVYVKGEDFAEVGGHKGRDFTPGGWVECEGNFTPDQADHIIEAGVKIGQRFRVKR